MCAAATAAAAASRRARSALAIVRADARRRGQRRRAAVRSRCYGAPRRWPLTRRQLCVCVCVCVLCVSSARRAASGARAVQERRAERRRCAKRLARRRAVAGARKRTSADAARCRAVCVRACVVVAFVACCGALFGRFSLTLLADAPEFLGALRAGPLHRAQGVDAGPLGYVACVRDASHSRCARQRVLAALGSAERFFFFVLREEKLFTLAVLLRNWQLSRINCRRAKSDTLSLRRVLPAGRSQVCKARGDRC